MADSRSIQKARLSAIKAKTYVPCVSCLACSASRPCSSCTSARKPCVRAAPVNASKVHSNIQHSSVERSLQHPDTLLTSRNVTFTVNIRVVSVLHYQHIRNLPAETSNTYPNQEDEAQLLDFELEHSCFVAYFGTASRPTIRLLSTRKHAALFGFHHEEFLARAASRELPMPFTEVDGLLDLLYRGVYNLFATGPPPDVYMRMAAGGGAAPRRGMLVCLHKEVLLDEQGRIREVSGSVYA